MTLEEIAKHAARHGQPQIMQWCCDQGWRPPRESFNGDFFKSAIFGASPAIFQILIDHGFDLHAHDSEDFGDALAYAVGWEEYEFAKWLLEHGHRPTPHDPYHGPSTISWTICGDTANQDMLKFLLDYRYDLKNSGAGVAAAEEGNVEALRLLLDRGVDIEDRDTNVDPFNTEDDEPYMFHATALYRACRQGNTECVKILLEAGADSLVEELPGTSYLDIARRSGFEDIVWLLENRAKGNSRCKPGQTLFGFLKCLFAL